MYKVSIKTKKADLNITSDFCIRVNFHENQRFHLQDMEEMNAAKEFLANGCKYVMIMSAPIMGLISSEARRFLRSMVTYRNAIARAIVTKKASVRLIGNFLLNLRRTPAPTRIFSNEKDAKKWLLQQIEKDLLGQCY